MKILTEAKVTAVKKNSGNVTATIEDKAGKKSEITVDRIISAVGVQGNIENLGLESTKVTTDRVIIQIDEYGPTAEPGIYAIGAVEGPLSLAHTSEHAGAICVPKTTGLNRVPPNKTEQHPRRHNNQPQQTT